MTTKRRNRGVRNTAAALGAVAVAVIIYCFSSQSGAESIGLSERVRLWLMETPFAGMLPMIADNMVASMRKWAHIFLYATLGFFSYMAVGVYAPVPCFLYSCLDEYHQKFVPGRTCNVSDLGYDACGWLAGIALAFALTRLWRSVRGWTGWEKAI